jgi:flagellar basal-body rod modification protein FlgD
MSDTSLLTTPSVNTSNILSDAIANMNKAASSSTSSSSSSSSYSSDYNTFLTILTTELKNQDPTSPLDTTQFTNQLVQFSNLEQSMSANSKLQSLVDSTKTGQTTAALGYLGHKITALGNSLPLDGSSGGNIQYTLAGNAGQVTVSIVNTAGQTVTQVPGTATSGSNTLAFDGKDAQGNYLPAGTYTYTVQAVDTGGNAVVSTPYISGTVTGIDTASGTTNLHLGSISVDASKVISVTAS